MSYTRQLFALNELQYYWPGVSRQEAEEILKKQDCDCFLVRDSNTYRNRQCISLRQEDRFIHSVIHNSGPGVGQLALTRVEGWDKNVREMLQKWPTELRPVYRCRTLQEICRSAIWRCRNVGNVTLPEHLLLFLHH